MATEPEPDMAGVAAGRDQGLPAARRVARNSALQAGGDAVAKLAGLAFYALVARSLGVTGFGELTLVMSLVLFVEIGGLGSDLVLVREVARDPATVHRLFWSATALRVAGGLVCAVGVTAVGVLGDFPADFAPALALMCLAWVVDIVLRTVLGTLRAHEDFRSVTTVTVVQRVGTCLAAAAVLAAGGELVAVCATWLGGEIVALGLATRFLYERGVRPRWDVTWPTVRWLMLEALPLGTSQIFFTVLARVDTLILAAYATTAAVGVYGAAYRLLDGVSFIPWAVGMAAMPVLTRAGRSTTPTAAEVFARAGTGLAAVIAPVAMTLVLFPGTVMRLVFGEAYAGVGATAAAWLGVAVAAYGPFALAVFALAAQRRQRVLPWAMAGAVVLNVAGNLYAAPRYGVAGVAAVMALTQIFVTAVLLVATRYSLGRLAGVRILAGPAAGAAAMAAIGLAAGGRAAALVPALLGYVVVLAAVERLAFPEDLRGALALLR